MTADAVRKEVAAAVCYRRRDGAIEFLLVRTKGGNKWTFPKGHVEKGETAREAAAREAHEEAGVAGTISDAPLTTYVYPAGSDGAGERSVPAYLLEVSQDEPQARVEGRREPTWFDPEAARRKLGEGGREPRYAEEHARVLETALAHLAGKPAPAR